MFTIQCWSPYVWTLLPKPIARLPRKGQLKCSFNAFFLGESNFYMNEESWEKNKTIIYRSFRRYDKWYLKVANVSECSLITVYVFAHFINMQIPWWELFQKLTLSTKPFPGNWWDLINHIPGVLIPALALQTNLPLNIVYRQWRQKLLVVALATIIWNQVSMGEWWHCGAVGQNYISVHA